MCITGTLSQANAQTASSTTYYYVHNHCKLIENKSRLVINYRDTVEVKHIDTVCDERGNKYTACTKDDSTTLIFNPYYYKNIPWLPKELDTNDSMVRSMLDKDMINVIFYYFYDKHEKEHERDSVQIDLLNNRAALIKHIKEHSL